jgi:hypothetical protein
MLEFIRHQCTSQPEQTSTSSPATRSAPCAAPGVPAEGGP